MGESATKINRGAGMVTIEDIDSMGVRCPVCGSYDYLSYKELYDNKWISLKCQCLDCKALFQINYKAACIDELKEPLRL